MAKHIVVFISCASKKEADKIADVLLAERLAACMNTVEKVHSMFHWQGKIDSADEVLLVAKTKAALLPELTSLVQQHHSYDVPEIIALPIIGGSDEYLNWIDAETIA